MRPIDADVLKQHIDKLPALPDGNFAGNHSALKALINMQPTIQPEKAQLFSENATSDAISRQDALDIFDDYNISVENGELEAYSRDRKRLCELPAAQP